MNAVVNLTPVEYSSERILTTEQLAQFYECETSNIKMNFKNNKQYFVEGKHFFKVEGTALNDLRVKNIYLQISPKTRSIYFWTKRGAARHAKMLNTEKAWEVFETLEESYFDGQKVVPTVQRVKPAEMIIDIGTTRDAIKSVFGVRDGIALAHATDMIGEFYGQDLSTLKNLLPPAEHKTGYLTPTNIGKQLNINAETVNNRLAREGLQVKVGKEWHLTEKGKNYAEEMPYTRNGHSGYQPKWHEKVIPLIREITLFD